MAASKKKTSEFLTYKGRPLVRSGDTLYYGNMYEKYVVKFDIKSKKKYEDLDISDKVAIQLISTDKNIGLSKKIIKTSEKDGLYSAIDIAQAWLDRVNNEDEDKD